MGGQQTKTTNQQEKLKINHPKFLNAKFVNISKQEIGIQISIPVANQKQVKDWEDQMKLAPTNLDSIFLPKSHKFTKQGFCGSSGYVNIVYDNFPFLLQDQILNRKSLQQKRFQQNQLWYLVFTLISCGNTIHEKGQKIGDIRPKNIFINQEGQVKIATNYSWPSQQSNYSKTFYQKEITYLSPQQMRDLQFGKMQPTSDFKLSEAFSIGLTILDAAILQNSDNLYGQNQRFNFDLLNKKLSTLFQQRYTELFMMLLCNLCTSDVANRCTCAQIFQWLRPYQQSIINLQDFQAQSVPDKFMKTKRVQNNSPLRQHRVQQFHNYSANKEDQYSGNSGFSNQVGFKNNDPNSYTNTSTIRPYRVEQFQNYSTNKESQLSGNLGFSNQPIVNNNNANNYANTTSTYKYESIYQPIYQIENKNNNGYSSSINPISADYYGRGNSAAKTTTVNVEKTTTTINNYGGSYSNYQGSSNNKNYVPTGGNNEFKSYLDKIDQQLRQSRKNFPSS